MHECYRTDGTTYSDSAMTRLLCIAVVLVTGLAVAAPPAVTAVAYHPEFKSVAFGLDDQVRVFEPVKGHSLGVATVPGRITAIAYHPSGKKLGVASGEPGKSGEVRFFVLDSDNRISASGSSTLASHKDAIYSIAFSPDGKTLATAGYDRLIHLWPVPASAPAEPAAPPKPTLTLKDHSDTVYALAWNHDGTLLASGSADRSVKVWDPANGKRLFTLGDPTDWVYCLAWSPDRKHLAAGSADKCVRIWSVDRNGGKLAQAAFAHEKPVWRVGYSDGGARLFTVGEDRILKSWDAARMSEKLVFPVQPDSVLDLAIAPGGKYLAVARYDGVAATVDALTGKQAVQYLPAQPAPPRPERIAPTAIPIGNTSTVTVKGKDLDQTTRVVSSRQDVKVSITSRSPESLTLQVVVPPGIGGATSLTLEGVADKSQPILLSLDRFIVEPESGTSDSVHTSQSVKLPVSIAGSVDRAGDVDYFRFDARAGDEIGVQLVASELGSKIDPVLVLTDSSGTVMAEGATALGYLAAKAGTYTIGVRDRDYRGGAEFIYRLHVGDIPVVTGVFPLAARRALPADVHLDGVNLGAPGGVRVRLAVPADAVPGTRMAVPVPRQALGKPQITIADLPSVVIDPVGGVDLRVPGSADGILARPREAQQVRFAARAGERLVVEVLARRADSPVDPVIEILDAHGRPVPRARLRATAKTFSTFRDHDSSGPGIRLEAWNELAIDDYLYANGELSRIVAMPRNPDDDCQFYQTAGKRIGFLGTTPVHHSQGSVMYKVEIHPPDRTFPPNGLPQFTIYYRNDDGGPGLDKDSFLLFDPPADGIYQVRIADARGAAGPSYGYRVTVRPPRPDFTVSFAPTSPVVWKGGGTPIGVTIARTDGFDGPVRLKLEGLPAGFSAPETSIEGGQTSTAFTLYAESVAQAPVQTRLKLVASAVINGKTTIHEAQGGMPRLVEPGDLVTRTSTQEVALRPGQESRFAVEITRNGKFTGRVPVEVRGLPHGVRVLDIGLNGILITERESSREVVLYAEPWVQSMVHPIVVLAKVEGRNADHAARPVFLKIAK